MIENISPVPRGGIGHPQDLTLGSQLSVQPFPAGRVWQKGFCRGRVGKTQISRSRGRVAIVLASVNLDIGFKPRAVEIAWEAHGQGNVT